VSTNNKKQNPPRRASLISRMREKGASAASGTAGSPGKIHKLVHAMGNVSGNRDGYSAGVSLPSMPGFSGVE
jgi:hypothetical protein